MKTGWILTVVNGGELHHDIAFARHVIDQGVDPEAITRAKCALADRLLREFWNEGVHCEMFPLTQELRAEILHFLERLRVVGEVNRYTMDMELQRIRIANELLDSMGLNAAFEPRTDEAPEDGPSAETSESRRRVVRRTIPFIVRAKIMARDGFKCVQCESVLALEIDHRIPLSKGGTDDEANLQTLCGRCNRRKGADLDT